MNMRVFIIRAQLSGSLITIRVDLTKCGEGGAISSSESANSRLMHNYSTICSSMTTGYDGAVFCTGIKDGFVSSHCVTECNRPTPINKEAAGFVSLK